MSGLHVLDEEEEEIQQDPCDLEVEEVEEVQVKRERVSFVCAEASRLAASC